MVFVKACVSYLGQQTSRLFDFDLEACVSHLMSLIQPFLGLGVLNDLVPPLPPPSLPSLLDLEDL